MGTESSERTGSAGLGRLSPRLWSRWWSWTFQAAAATNLVQRVIWTQPDCLLGPRSQPRPRRTSSACPFAWNLSPLQALARAGSARYRIIAFILRLPTSQRNRLSEPLCNLPPLLVPPPPAKIGRGKHPEHSLPAGPLGSRPNEAAVVARRQDGRPSGQLAIGGDAEAGSGSVVGEAATSSASSQRLRGPPTTTQ